MLNFKKIEELSKSITDVQTSFVLSCTSKKTLYFLEANNNLRNKYKLFDYDENDLKVIKQKLCKRKYFKNDMRNWEKRFNRAEREVHKYLKSDLSELNIYYLIEGYIISNSKIIFDIIMNLLDMRIRENTK